MIPFFLTYARFGDHLGAVFLRVIVLEALLLLTLGAAFPLGVTPFTGKVTFFKLNAYIGACDYSNWLNCASLIRSSSTYMPLKSSYSRSCLIRCD